MSHAQQIFSEIELFLDAGRFEDAKILLGFLDPQPLDRESQLYLLLINTKLDGPARHKREIGRLASLPAPTELEKEIIRKILELQSNATEPKHVSASSESQLLDPTSELSSMPAERAVFETRFKETLRSLENQLREKQHLLQSREADVRKMERKVNQLSEELIELERARDDDGRLLRAELAQKNELLRIGESALNPLRERLAAQIRDLQTELAEQQSLVMTCEEEIESLKRSSGVLTEEQAQREALNRMLQEELSQKALRLQAAETLGAETERKLSAKIQWLELQLAKKQQVIESNGAELAALRNRMQALAAKLADTELAKLRAETLLQQQAKQAHNEYAVDGSFAESPVAQSTAPRQTRHAQDDNDSKWLTWLSDAWQTTRNPKIWRDTALPATVAMLLLIPIAYYLPGDMPKPPRDTQASAAPPPTAAGLAEPAKTAINPAQSLIDTNVSKTMNAARRTSKRNESAPSGPYRTRRVVYLRAEPRYGADAKLQIGAGTSISVLEASGDWVKVKAQPSGDIGFMRKEYLIRQSWARLAN